MACPPVTTGSEFLVQSLAHLDCQAQTLGSFGFQALAEPGSVAGVVLTVALTLFIAIYAIRMLFGPGDEPRDVVGAVLKVGIVLTMAVSWPAWRVVAYDTVLYGPAEVAATIMPSTVADPRAGFTERLQTIDTGIAALTYAGTGRQTGEESQPTNVNTFRSVAMPDEAGLGWSRPIYLATTIGSLAVVRIGAGLLLALAPLLAALLLFQETRGLFSGWLRGLLLTAVGSLGLTVLFSVQIAVMEPWLADLLQRRALGYAVPTAPTELLGLVLAFAAATAGLMFLLAKVTFQPGWAPFRQVTERLRTERGYTAEPVLVATGAGAARIPAHSRALAISESVEAQVRREEGGAARVDRIRVLGTSPSAGPSSVAGGRTGAPHEPLGSGYRRAGRRDMQSQRRRDDRA